MDLQHRRDEARARLLRRGAASRTERDSTRRSRAARLVSVSGALALVAVLLTGCFLLPQPAPSPTPSSGGTGEDVAAELAPFYEQTVDWQLCGGGSGADTRCAQLEAPLDWDDPSGERIELALVEVAASGTSRGSLFMNPGGPGGSGYDFVHDAAEYAASPALRAEYDLVGWDPRGVGRSTPVTCLDDDEKDELLYGTFDDPYDSPGWIDELEDQQQEFADACVANTGELLGHIDTASVARDLDMMRAALGNASLDYLGYSYGTQIGATYAELFPDKVGHLMLDGAVDPTLSDFVTLAVQMTGFENAARAYMADCLASSGCPFDGTLDEGLAQLRALLDRIDGVGMVGDDGRVLDEATVGTGLAYTLYSEGSWPALTRMAEDLFADEPSSAFANADAYNGRLPGGGYDSNSFEVYTAVTCLDGDFAADGATTLQRLAEIDAAAPTVGRAIALDDFAVLDTVCSTWPEPTAELPDAYDAEGAAPILVIGTTNDPATPYAWARSLAQQLSSGVLVTYQGEGHTVYNQGVTCIDDTVDAYFLDDVVPAADPMC